MFIFGGFDGAFFNSFSIVNTEPFGFDQVQNTFYKDIASLVNNSDFSDVKFLIGEDLTPIYANKSLLLYRWAGDYVEEFSLFFSNIFYSDSDIKYKLVKPESFLHLLEFLYCGRFVSYLTVNQVNEVL